MLSYYLKWVFTVIFPKHTLQVNIDKLIRLQTLKNIYLIFSFILHFKRFSYDFARVKFDNVRAWNNVICVCGFVDVEEK